MHIFLLKYDISQCQLQNPRNHIPDFLLPSNNYFFLYIIYYNESFPKRDLYLKNVCTPVSGTPVNSRDPYCKGTL